MEDGGDDVVVRDRYCLYALFASVSVFVSTKYECENGYEGRVEWEFEVKRRKMEDEAGDGDGEDKTHTFGGPVVPLEKHKNAILRLLPPLASLYAPTVSLVSFWPALTTSSNVWSLEGEEEEPRTIMSGLLG